MKVLAFIIVSCVLSLTLTYLGPWWLLIFGPLLSGFLFKYSPITCFIWGFFSIISLWGGLIGWKLLGSNTKILEKMALLLPLEGSKTAMLLIILLVGGLLGGFAAIHGAYWRKFMRLEN